MEQSFYVSYLLRLWQTRNGGELVWRASLQSPHTGERRGFANVAELFTFLEEVVSKGSQGQLVPGADVRGDDARK